MSALNVVALISGGKDSLFSILHCIANGHKLVALANLYPSDEELQDTDSFMYQTIGHAIIPLYGQALGLPLYRQKIRGVAVNQAKCYGPETVADETEDLVPLLRRVLVDHPHINAVSAGAILSDYQRTRIESVAVRLGLIPLAYLWQWPTLPPHTEESLLHDMAVAGQDARIVKVASGGLNESMLWQNVADPHTISRLKAAAQRFGTTGDGAILGEGGEYETLAIRGPAPLWKGDIVFSEADRKIALGEAGSAAVHLRNPHVQAKPQSDHAPSRTPREIPLLDLRFQNILEDIKVYSESATPSSERMHFNTDGRQHKGPYLFMPNLTGFGPDAGMQTHSIMDRLSYRLPEYGHNFSDVIYVSIVLRDMKDFAQVNAVYGSYFAKPNPPSRVTLACAGILPDNCHLAIGITSFHENSGGTVKAALHVQSRSYWAPANIGPYSQATLCPLPTGGNVHYIAGQIPLVPASMKVATASSAQAGDSFSLQAVLALQHLSRIGTCVNVREWVAAIAFVVAENPELLGRIKAIAKHAWTLLHVPETSPDDGEGDTATDFDVWDSVNVHANRTFANPKPKTVRQRSRRNGAPPPLFVIQVDALPRGCSIEWVSYGCSGSALDISMRDIPHLQHLLGVFSDNVV